MRVAIRFGEALSVGVQHSSCMHFDWFTWWQPIAIHAINFPNNFFIHLSFQIRLCMCVLAFFFFLFPNPVHVCICISVCFYDLNPCAMLIVFSSCFVF